MSPDGRTLYHNDNTQGRIYAFDYAHDGLTGKSLFAETPALGPTGRAWIQPGVLHVGIFNGWGVARFSPDGERLEPIRMPVQTVTGAAFGGENLRYLYCTTAWLGNAGKRTGQPGLGGHYRGRVETPGLPQALARL